MANPQTLARDLNMRKTICTHSKISANLKKITISSVRFLQILAVVASPSDLYFQRKSLDRFNRNYSIKELIYVIEI